MVGVDGLQKNDCDWIGSATCFFRSNLLFVYLLC